MLYKEKADNYRYQYFSFESNVKAEHIRRVIANNEYALQIDKSSEASIITTIVISYGWLLNMAGYEGSKIDDCESYLYYFEKEVNELKKSKDAKKVIIHEYIKAYSLFSTLFGQIDKLVDIQTHLETLWEEVGVNEFIRINNEELKAMIK
jgi:hypothetical protein